MNSSSLSNRSDKELQIVARLKTVDECRQFAINQKGNIGLTNAVARRLVEIQVSAHANETTVVQDVWRVVYSYESLLFSKRGKRHKANYTRRSISNHGEITAVERIVCQRAVDDNGFARLSEAGLQDKTFEALVLRHPKCFSETTIEQARTKLGQLRS
jgi:hypothetical protein